MERNGELPVKKLNLMQENLIKKQEETKNDNNIKESIFATLLSDKHMRSVFNFVVSTCIILTLKTILINLYYDDRNGYGFRLVKIAFRRFDVTIAVWIIAFIIHLSIYWGWRLWNARRPFKDPFLWDTIWICMNFIAYFGTFHALGKISLKYDFGLASKMAIFLEQTRLIMKGHAFVRSKCPKVIGNMNHKQLKVPTFINYIYFSFAPTLVYQDFYKRSRKTRWTKVLKHFAEILGLIYFMSLIESEYFLKRLSNFGKTHFTILDIIILILDCAIPAFLYVIMFVNLVAHSVQQCVGEIIRFADRTLIFQDWWTQTNMSDFYTTWNIVVQDWLYTYIYKDIYHYFTRKNRTIAKLSVFFLSIVLHEVILYYVLRIICPVFASAMLISLFMMEFKWKARMCNVIVMWGCVTGLGYVITIMHLEYFALLNCPNQNQNNRFISNFQMRLFNCF